MKTMSQLWRAASRFFPALGLVAIGSASLWAGPLGNGRIPESLGEVGGFLLMLAIAPLWYVLASAAVRRLGPSVAYVSVALPFGFLTLYFANEFNFCVTCGGGHCGSAGLFYLAMVGFLTPAALLVASLGFSSPHPATVLIPLAVFFLPWWLPVGLAGEIVVVFLSVAALTALDGALAVRRMRSLLPQSPAEPLLGNRPGLIATSVGTIFTVLALILLFVSGCSRWWIYPENLLFLGPSLLAAGLGLCRIRRTQHAIYSRKARE